MITLKAEHPLYGKGDGYCESFNGRFRDELLNGEIFYSLKEAQIDPPPLSGSTLIVKEGGSIQYGLSY